MTTDVVNYQKSDWNIKFCSILIRVGNSKNPIFKVHGFENNRQSFAQIRRSFTGKLAKVGICQKEFIVEKSVSEKIINSERGKALSPYSKFDHNNLSLLKDNLF